MVHRRTAVGTPTFLAAIVVTAVVVAAAVFTSSALYTTVTRTEATTTTVFTQSSATTETSTSSNATTSCNIITGPTIGVVIQVVENTPQGVSPIAGAQISGQAVGYCNNLHALNATASNSSGWASLLDGQFSYQYDLAITYVPPLGSTLAFNMSIVTYTEAVTYATFNISTGNVTTHICGDDFECATH
jgi:hypothetical protein